MNEADFFFGAAILLIAQCLIAGSINLINPKVSNKLLGVLIILFLDYYRYILYGFCINQELLNALLLSKFSLAQFYGPVIFLFLVSIVRPVSSKQFRYHLSAPGLFTIYLIVLIGLKYLYGISIYDPFIAVSFLFTVIYVWLSFKLINSDAWENIKIAKRYKLFFYVVGGYLLFNQVIHVLKPITSYFELNESLKPVYGFLEKGAFIVANNYLFFFGLTEVNALKRLFVPYNSESGIAKLNGNRSRILEKIESSVQEGIYRDPNLNLEFFAGRIGITKSQLSDFFRSHYKVGFTEKLNQWRLEEFKKNLTDQKLSHLDLLGLAHEAGFNSKATFNRYFKKSEGITPSEYRRLRLKEQEDDLSKKSINRSA